MVTLSSVIQELKSAPPRIESAVKDVVQATGANIQSLLYTASPINSGTFQSGWSLGSAYSSPGVLGSVKITNAVPYASAIDFGIDPSSSHSWARSIANKGKRNKAAKIAAAVGIIPKDTRVWSSSAIGGVSARVITDSLVRNFAMNVANSIISSIGK